MKYSKQQIYHIAAAIMFLIGAIFMLINTFADQLWAFGVGAGFAGLAAVFYIFLWIENRRIISKKLTDSIKDSSYSDKSKNSFEYDKKTEIQTTENKTPEV